MKRFLEGCLARLARRVIKRHDPLIIGVTGSYGKTSTRMAVFEVLKAAGKSVYTPIKNYNNEIGFPLGILMEESPGRQVAQWIPLLFRAWNLGRAKQKDYPDVLVLEYALDKVGDIGRLCDIVEPDIAILTGVSPVHASQVGTLETIVKEKRVLGERVKEGGVVFVNADDPRAEQLTETVTVPTYSYGFTNIANFRVMKYELNPMSDDLFEVNEHYTNAQIEIQSPERAYAFNIPNVIGKPVASHAAASVAVSERLNVHADQINVGLTQIQSRKGRLHPMAGIKGSLVIDDTYNASPAAMAVALDVLGEFQLMNDGRRIAVLGAMAELGNYTEQEHRAIGIKAAEMGIDLLLCVGEPATYIADAAREAGIPGERIHLFNNAYEAGRWLDPQIQPGDIVLVKGSQSARMERVVHQIMAEPLRAPELLVRQSDSWLKTA